MGDSREAMRLMLQRAKQTLRRRADGDAGNSSNSTTLANSFATDTPETLGGQFSAAQKKHEQRANESLLNAKDNQKEFALHYYHVIKRFIADASKFELEMPKLSGYDRLVVHAIAEQCNLSHTSSGVGENRLLRLKKDALFFQHPEAVELVNLEAIVRRISEKESKFHLRRTRPARNDDTLPEIGEVGSYFDEEALEKIERLRRATDDYRYATTMEGEPTEECLEDQPWSGEEDSVANSSRALPPTPTFEASSGPPPSFAPKRESSKPSISSGRTLREDEPTSQVEVCRSCFTRVPIARENLRGWRCEKFCSTCAALTIWRLEGDRDVPEKITGSRKRTAEVMEGEAVHANETAASNPVEEIERFEPDEELLFSDAMDLIAMNDFHEEDAQWLRQFATAVEAAGEALQNHLTFCINFQDLMHLSVFQRYEYEAKKLASVSEEGPKEPPLKLPRSENVIRTEESNVDVIYIVVREYKSLEKSLSSLLMEVLEAVFSSLSIPSGKLFLDSVAPLVALALPNVSVYNVEATAICQIRTHPLSQLFRKAGDATSISAKSEKGKKKGSPKAEVEDGSPCILALEELNRIAREYGRNHVFCTPSLSEAIEKGNNGPEVK